jgi:hypothetical protein
VELPKSRAPGCRVAIFPTGRRERVVELFARSQKNKIGRIGGFSFLRRSVLE